MIQCLRSVGLGAALLASLAMIACGGGGGSAAVVNNASTVVANTLPVALNASFFNGYQNEPMVSVTVCAPGTTTCQTIPDVLLDTGSYGLRLLAAETTVALPTVNTAANEPAGECAQFADAFDWGPVVGADVELAGEKADSVPVQLMGSSSFAGVPSGCTNTGLTETDTQALLGANGILGVGNYTYDCGTACASTNNIPVYFSCPAGGSCASAPAAMPLQRQVQNPVWLFPQDNNGVLLSLPSVGATGSAAITGSLIFGIGTQSDNALGSASVYTLDQDGNIATLFNNNTYSSSFLDSGSNGLFFLDAGTLGQGVTDCSGSDSYWYCPSATVNFSASVRGANGTVGQAPFSIANAETLFATSNAVFSNLAGSNPDEFDFGLPFFLGRNIYVGIDGQTTPAGIGPFWAF